MTGRGKNILQALKEKKEREERERSQSPSSVRQPLLGNVESQQTTTASTSAPRGVGRGQLAALLASRQMQRAESRSPPPVSDEPGVQVLYYSAEKAARPVPKRLSPVEPLPESTLQDIPPQVRRLLL